MLGSARRAAARKRRARSTSPTRRRLPPERALDILGAQQDRDTGRRRGRALSERLKLLGNDEVEWFHLDLPRHLWHFPLAALRSLLETSGFDVESEHHFSLRQNPFGWVQSALNRVPGLPRNGLYTLLQRRAPDTQPAFTPAIRLWLWLSLLALAPLALAATGVETVLRSGATVHFGVRRGTVYLDPELLLAGWRPVPRLIPTDGAPPRRLRAERLGAGEAARRPGWRRSR